VPDLVVADSGPLIAQARVQLLTVLPKLFGRVAVPSAVWEEVTSGAAQGRAGAADVQSADWVDVVVAPPSLAAAYALLVDRGEAEALAYASENTDAENTDALLLIDDRRGRRVAAQLGIAHRGTAGLLVQARRLGVFPELRPVLQALARAGGVCCPRGAGTGTARSRGRVRRPGPLAAIPVNPVGRKDRADPERSR
jgi:predicted nucleic acid-binding protein